MGFADNVANTYRIVEVTNALDDRLVREVQLRSSLNEAEPEASQLQQHVFHRGQRLVVIVELCVFVCDKTYKSN